MNTPFLTCTNCGQRSADTKRCKHCGQVFGRAPQQASDAGSKRSWFPIVAVFGLVAIIAVGLQQWWRRPLVAPFPDMPETTITPAPAETAAVSTPAPPPAIPVDTLRAVAPARVEPQKESLPQVVDTTRPAAPPPAESVTIDPERQRYAKTWANVRAERNSAATVLQVLDRGEIVAIDSLEGGWYRVTTSRPVVGYVDQQFLDTVPPVTP